MYFITTYRCRTMLLFLSWTKFILHSDFLSFNRMSFVIFLKLNLFGWYHFHPPPPKSLSASLTGHTRASKKVVQELTTTRVTVRWGAQVTSTVVISGGHSSSTGQYHTTSLGYSPSAASLFHECADLMKNLALRGSAGRSDIAEVRTVRQQEAPESY